MSTRGQGWITKAARKKGDVYIHHFYTTRESDGARVETCRTIGAVAKFPREADVWAEVERSQRISTNGTSGRTTVAGLVEHYRATELPGRAHSVQELHRYLLDDLILVRWGKTYVDEVRVLDLKKWFMAIAEERQWASETVQKLKQVFGRLFRVWLRERAAPDEPQPRQGVQH